MTKKDLARHVLKALILSSAVSLSSAAIAGEKIKQVVIKGNKRIERSTIEHYITMGVGDEYTKSEENQSIKKLYSTALFDDVSISYNKGSLIVEVMEPSFISKVEFVGNSRLGKKTLGADLLTTPGESASKSKIQADAQKIKEIYKRSGRFNVLVEPKIEMLENNRAKVVFYITESPKTKIKNIYISGNEYYSDNELKTVLLTKEKKWFRFLSSNDVYDPGRIEHDKHLLKRFYNSVGFADFSILSATAELSVAKDYFTVTFSIQEGVKYNFGDITIDNEIEEIDDEILQKFINIKSGKLFNLSEAEDIAEEMTAELARRGYPYVNTYPEVDTNPAERTADIRFVVSKSRKAFIERIDISGNLKTHDKVIRREIEFDEGDLFNRDGIDRSKRNLRNLNYFRDVVTDIKPTDRPDKYIMDINVAEKSTASIGFDVGYDSTNGMFGAVSFNESNLAGTGKRLNAMAKIGKSTTNYSLSVTEPYFLDKKLALSVSAYNNIDSKSSGLGGKDKNYDSKVLGGDIAVGYDFAKDLRHTIRYGLSRSKINIIDDKKVVPRFIQQRSGKRITSKISHSFSWDKLDNRYLPKNGFISTFTQQFAGLGGDDKYLKHEVDAQYYKSFYKNKITLKFSASAGMIKGVGGKKVPLNDRFNLGEPTLRGFEAGGIGPRVKTAGTKGDGDAIGGEKYYAASAELMFPLPGVPEEMDLKGALFVDCGSVFGVNPSEIQSGEILFSDKSPRVSAGFGFLWITRMAPIRVDWGYALKKKSYDKKQIFHIKFSTSM